MTTTVPVLSLFVPGKPIPQGSKSINAYGAMYDQSGHNLDAWRNNVAGRAMAVRPPGGRVALTGPAAVSLEFVLPRPVRCPKRTTPPAVKKPDLDKLERAILDALTAAGVWRDDAQVTELRATKRIAELGETPGVHISVRPVVAEVAA